MTTSTRRPLRRRWAILAGVVSLLLATVGVTTLTSAASAQNPAATTTAAQAPDFGIQAVPGNWTLAFDWGCDGSYSTTAMVFNANGTWSNSTYTGLWISVAGMITFTFDGSETTYSGTLASRSVTGIQTTFAGLNGCFYMLQAGAPTFAAAQDDSADAAGRVRKS